MLLLVTYVSDHVLSDFFAPSKLNTWFAKIVTSSITVDARSYGP